MTRTILPRVNWFDGQEVVETDMDVEQTAWHDSLSNNTDFIAGSGVEKEFAVQRVLLDTNDVPSSISSIISSQNFDGEPIYPTDSFGLTVYDQPSDSSEGNYLEVEISGASLTGSAISKVYIFGTTFGGDFIHEVLAFEDNGSLITRNYFATITAIMTQNFRGNQNTIVDGTACYNVGGRLRILEAIPMSLARDTIMAEQSIEPSMDYVNFKPATLSKTLDTLLSEIAATDSLDADDLNINVTATTTRTLPVNDSTGRIIGQKFLANTNNIQKVSILLAVQENTLAVAGAEYDWSGDLVVGIRKLQTTTQCPTDTIPNSSIEFDPEPSPIAEVSFDQDEMANLGIVLGSSPQIVDFIFTQSLVANPNLEPTIEVGSYYMVTVRRSGDISTGTIILQEAANTNASPTEVDPMRMSVFSQNVWTDVADSDLWFQVHTNAVRLTDGTAFDGGTQVTSPKTVLNSSTGLEESYSEGDFSLYDVSSSVYNYVTVQKSTDYSTSIPHPSTGNLVFTRIKDVPSISVVPYSTISTLISAENEPIIIGSARDTNPVGNPQITGTTTTPGLLGTTTFTIINPTSDIYLNNLVGSILTPNTSNASLKYRIVGVTVTDDAYGDVNGDTSITIADVTRAQALDGYSKDLQSGSLPSVDQRNAIVAGTVTMEEIIRADVNNDGVIDILDAQQIQQYISLGTAFSAGSTFKKAVITVESLTNPLTSTPNMISADSSFNTVPFSDITYRIEFVPLWKQHNLEIVDLRRFVPKTFTQITTSEITATSPTGGKNTSFIPGDILLGGDILDTDGSTYSIDLEVNTVVIDLPEGSTQGEVDIFSNFIQGQMTFYDGSAVTTSALSNDQVRVSAGIQSFVKDTDGYDFESVDGYTKVETTIAVLYTQSSGILRIRADNVRNVSARPELRTKIILTVFLKKAGFTNSETSVTASEFQELLSPI